ncbi:MAG: HDOD domain-containing protein [Marinagarivorans sp.]|nr:HDOD domain-containing protein [Marinagarivorans sp.]
MSSQLQQWVARLTQENLPGFAVTAKRLAQVTADDSSAQKVADIILPDAPMTVAVLKLANSVYYNPSRRKIDTLNYACVILGVKVVRDLIMTAASLGSHPNHEFSFQFQREIAFSFHAAMQAQNIARLRGLQQDENIYIAALLSRLGYWIFWCFPYGYGEKMAACSAGLEDFSSLETEVLGFSLSALTDALLNEWKLMPLSAIQPKQPPFTDSEQCIHEAFLLAAQLRKGWHHQGFLETSKRLVSLCRLPKADLHQALIGCVVEVRRALKQVDIDKRFWPPLEDENPFAHDDESLPLLQQALARDLQIKKQQRYLRQLTHMLCHKLDMARFFHGLLDGVCKTIIVENAFVIMPHTKQHVWRIAMSHGPRAPTMAQHLIDLTLDSNDVLINELKAGRTCWPPINLQIVGIYQELFGGDQYCIFPLRLGGKNVGFIGAVKAPSGTLSEDDFEVFCHFCDLALLAVKLSLIDSGVHGI